MFEIALGILPERAADAILAQDPKVLMLDEPINGLDLRWVIRLITMYASSAGRVLPASAHHGRNRMDCPPMPAVRLLTTRAWTAIGA